MGIRIGDCVWGFGLGIKFGDWELGLEIGDWDWGLEYETWDWGLRLGIRIRD